ncbi:Na+/H+ antiporter NhaC family protein [Peptostreptococcaceae bacterium AGR-M142]
MNSLKKEIKKLDSIILCLFNLIFIVACIYFNIPVYLGFFMGIIFTLLLLKNKNYNIKEVIKIGFNGVKECKIAIFIVFLMGANISSWISGGVVPSMIYYGFNFISDFNFLITAFLLCALVSVFMGTAVGTFSTIGIALIGIGRGIGIPLPILVGTLISAAYLADRISPISGLVNLTLDVNKIDFDEFLKSSLKTISLGLLISLVFYYFLGNKYMSGIDQNVISTYQKNLSDSFYISKLFLAFPLVMMVLAFKKVNVFYNMSVGVILGALAGLFYQDMNVLDVINSLIFGYESNTNIMELDSILKGGGAFNMKDVVLLNIAAIFLNSILQELDLLMPLLEDFKTKIRTTKSLYFKTGLLSFILTMVTCNQVVSIVFVTKLLKDKFDEFNINKVELSRTIADSGTLIAPVFPWNVNAILIGLIVNLNAFEYAPYAIYCYIAPIIAILYGFIFRNKDENKIITNNFNKVKA